MNNVQDAIIYQLQMRTFTREGTIKRATELLPHVSSLGVNTLYLTPLCESDDCTDPEFFSDRQKVQANGNPKNPYRIKDYFKVDSEYGDEGDLIEFVNRAHSLGLKVMFDLVYLHCGPTAGLLEQNDDFCNRDENGKPIPAAWHFPKLNFDSPNLREYLYSNMKFLIDKYGIDGYRCDVGDRIPLDFWEEGIKRIKKEHPDFLMLNEGSKVEYFSVFDLQYHFPWSITTTRKIARGEMTADGLREFFIKYASVNARQIHTSETHDSASDDIENRLEVQAKSPRLTDMILVLNFTLPGVPFIFDGQEFADAGRCNMFANRFYPPNFGIDWSMLATERGQQRMELVRRLCKIRTENTALRGECDEYPETEAFTMIRRADGNTVTVICNPEDKEIIAEMPQGKCVLSDGFADGVMSPYSYAVFVSES